MELKTNKAMKIHMQCKHPDRYQEHNGQALPIGFPCSQPGCSTMVSAQHHVPDHLLSVHGVASCEKWARAKDLGRMGQKHAFAHLKRETKELNTVRARFVVVEDKLLEHDASYHSRHGLDVRNEWPLTDEESIQTAHKQQRRQQLAHKYPGASAYKVKQLLLGEDLAHLRIEATSYGRLQSGSEGKYLAVAQELESMAKVMQ